MSAPASAVPDGAGCRAVIDIGKSATRARVRWPEGTVDVEHPGVEPSVAGSPTGPAALAGVLRELVAHARHQGAPEPSDVVVGTTAAPSTATGRAELLDRLAQAWPGARVVVAEDGVVAHAAALGGPGVVAAVGTGVAVSAVDTAGCWSRFDGWGPDLGDRGGAVGLGTAGLRAAYAAIDGVGLATALLARAAVHLGGTDLAAAVRLLARPDRVGAQASFAHVVCDVAPVDEVAARLVADAATELVATAAAACARADTSVVVLVGRLAGHPAYHAAAVVAARAAGLTVGVPRCGVLDITPGVLLAPPYRALCDVIGEVPCDTISTRPPVEEMR